MLISLVKEANSFYGLGDLKSLINLLAGTSAIMAIMVNIQISLDNQSYSEESSTLQYTLLPYLNIVEDYGILIHQPSYTMSRFIKSLTDHILDTSCQVGNGFIICSLKFESSKLQSIVPILDNKIALQSALVHLKYSPNNS